MRVWTYALTLLVSAFLLFFVQPMIARFLLPYWGGGTGVWAVCLLFFQGVLLLGYLYAHALVRFARLRIQAIGHAGLLTLSLVAMPISPGPSASRVHDSLPALELLWVLARGLGLPCLLLSASAPLLQHWFSHGRAQSPYRLYAVSNAGSLLGLLSYPLLIEPRLGLATQARFWSAGYLVLVAFSVACAIVVSQQARTGLAAPELNTASDAPSPTLATRSLWLALSAAGVLLLLSITTEITTNLVPMPLLWVLPLGLYLLTFIACFATDAAYARRRWLTVFCLTILPTLWLPAITPLLGVWAAVALSCLCLVSGCMICHGELAQRKPHHKDLSSYYVYLAFGGVLGSAFVNFAAPLIFDRYWDLAIALFGIFALSGLGLAARGRADAAPRDNPLGLPEQRRAGLGLGAFAIWLLGGAAFAFVGTLPLRAQHGTLAAARSFYGTLSVVEDISEGAPARTLLHGRIRHGSQFLGEARRDEATLYFSASSGVGMALSHSAYHGPRHIGVVGLGVGTLASYGKPGDRIRFYELDPLVLSFATRYFSFIGDSAADVQVVLGDGRLSLEREWATGGSNGFDILVLDAFNADALPTHLITREAFALYWQHLKPNGTLAVNVTNTFLDLAPLVSAQARALGKEALQIRANQTQDSRAASTWILVTDNPALLGDPGLQEKTNPISKRPQSLWTDNYSNILEALK